MEIKIKNNLGSLLWQHCLQQQNTCLCRVWSSYHKGRHGYAMILVIWLENNLTSDKVVHFVNTSFIKLCYCKFMIFPPYSALKRKIPLVLHSFDVFLIYEIFPKQGQNCSCDHSQLMVNFPTFFFENVYNNYIICYYDFYIILGLNYNTLSVQISLSLDKCY